VQTGISVAHNLAFFTVILIVVKIV
jgi:hypothetical protein